MTPLDRRSLISGAGALAISASALSACERGNRDVWVAADTHAADYPTVAAVEDMGRRLAEATGGRLRLRTYPGGQLGEEKDTLELTIFGGVDLNRINLAPMNAVVPETIVPTLPFLFRSVGHMRAAMDGAPGRAILDAFEPHGLIGLCFYDSGARSFYNTRRPIRTPEDVRGLKIRVQNSDLFVAMVTALGGDATPMPFGEVYQALVQGVVDGAENNWPSFVTTRHYEAARYYALTEHVMAPEVLVMSAHTWRRLSDADRQIVRDCALLSAPVMRAAWDARVEASIVAVRAAGVEVTEDVDKAAFAAAVAPVWDRFLNTPALRQLADDILPVESPDV